ncbi:MAG: leucyl/phenylalanyl-tRNA--protein transferase [Oligoflexia bacterium]|nr:leucyl/phenylalanyl-tRNA--protein transferase [Oligoflexia bacterium]MBF0366649.1 leucyl/phenylalanyl-tRNA--protein transferase [Oligoflexia bacterium]
MIEFTSNIKFPPVELASSEGLLAVGGDLEVATLLEAYTNGIFPWPCGDDFPLTWFSPNPRGVLFFSEIHRPRSLQKFINKSMSKYRVYFNRDFPSVIRECAKATRPSIERDDMSTSSFATWITEEIISAYINLHLAGLAYSVEVYETSKEMLVGGVYGVNIGHYYSGESMFYKHTNASKIALLALADELSKQGIAWLDTQMVTPVVKHLGGREIDREEFRALLTNAITKEHFTLR